MDGESTKERVWMNAYELKKNKVPLTRGAHKKVRAHTLWTGTIPRPLIVRMYFHKKFELLSCKVFEFTF